MMQISYFIINHVIVSRMENLLLDSGDTKLFHYNNLLVNDRFIFLIFSVNMCSAMFVSTFNFEAKYVAFAPFLNY